MSLTFVPDNRMGWWGGADTRERCRQSDKVVFTEERAKESARKATERGTRMHAYKCNGCGAWHTARTRR